MDNSYIYLSVLVVIVVLVMLACSLKQASEKYMDFLPTSDSSKYLLESDNLSAFDYVNNTTCLQCWRDYSNYNICAPYCTKGFRI